MKTLARVLGIVGITAVVGCSEPPSQLSYPRWVDQLIEGFRSQPIGNPPQSVWQYQYKAQTVYFVPAQCCDLMSTLYDNSQNVMCNPDGGIGGNGDGRCTDFKTARTNEVLIWKDPRAP